MSSPRFLGMLSKIFDALGVLLSLLSPNLLYTMWSKSEGALLTALVSGSMAVDLSWHAPAASQINNLASVTNGTGVYGFIYDTSVTPDDKYGLYNWCNMPHVRKTEYVKPSNDYKLQYVELIHRHHKRTPYASNAFPVESYPWNCSDQGLFYYGAHFSSNRTPTPAQTYWKGYTSPINPFSSPGFIGSCQFPQITAQGLDDSFQHGADLYSVYHSLLNFLPGRCDEDWHQKVSYRVTTNQITSQVASQVVSAMFGTGQVALNVQQSSIDSLEPAYPCSAASSIYDGIKSTSNPVWKAHLDAASGLYKALDDISGVSTTDSGWHIWLDHYYDNLSARECHSKPLPCKIVDGMNSSTCVTREMADEVYRFGHWEYSRLYRDSEGSLAASVASMGVWIAELSDHLRKVVEGKGGEVVYRHNVAHDGSMSRLLSVLQIDTMVWPGMGSEVVFELYEKKGDGGWFVRVLFGGQPFKSSNPSLGVMDMLPVETLLGYLDGLVGVNAALVPGKCKGTA